MNGMNSVTIMGRLAADPKPIKDDGCQFDLIYTTIQGGKTREESFVVKVYPPQAAAVMEYCREGKLVMVNGFLRAYDRGVVMVIGRVVQFLPDES